MTPEPHTLARRQEKTRTRIASEAARLVVREGRPATTVDQISDAAEVSRATFFRYFASKELAVAEGVAEEWLPRLSEAIRRQPVRASALEAIRGAFADLAPWFRDNEMLFVNAAQHARSSVTLRAWTLERHRRAEEAIAELVAPRIPDLRPGDIRPRLIGSIAMTTSRLVIDQWLADEQRDDLPRLMQEALAEVSVR